jgi:hypothetical protein
MIIDEMNSIMTTAATSTWKVRRHPKTGFYYIYCRKNGKTDVWARYTEQQRFVSREIAIKVCEQLNNSSYKNRFSREEHVEHNTPANA